MPPPIPTISFHPSPKGNFEILSLQSLFARQHDHLLTQPQRISFNLVLLFTQGEGTHHIDFQSYRYRGRICFL